MGRVGCGNSRATPAERIALDGQTGWSGVPARTRRVLVENVAVRDIEIAATLDTDVAGRKHRSGDGDSRATISTALLRQRSVDDGGIPARANVVAERGGAL